MRASYNELRSLFKQVYQGAGLATGWYEAAADNVVWTQAIGQNSFDLFEQQIEAGMAFNACEVETNQDERELLAVDLGDACLSYGAHIVAGLAQARALELDECVCTIKTKAPKTFLLKEIAKLKPTGLRGLVVWNEGEHAILAEHCADGLGIRLDKQLRIENIDDQALFLLAKSPERLTELIARYYLGNEQHRAMAYSADDLQSHFQENLQSGIKISPELWQKLTDLAAHSLVEATEQSRRGAGA